MQKEMINMRDGKVVASMLSRSMNRGTADAEEVYACLKDAPDLIKNNLCVLGIRWFVDVSALNYDERNKQTHDFGIQLKEQFADGLPQFEKTEFDLGAYGLVEDCDNPGFIAVLLVTFVADGKVDYSGFMDSMRREHRTLIQSMARFFYRLFELYEQESLTAPLCMILRYCVIKYEPYFPYI